MLDDVEQPERGVRHLACGLYGWLLTAEARIRRKHLRASFQALVGWVSSSQTHSAGRTLVQQNKLFVSTDGMTSLQWLSHKALLRVSCVK